MVPLTAAQCALVEEHCQLAVKCLAGVFPQAVRGSVLWEYDDMLSAAYAGLVDAAQRWNPTHASANFGPYAVQRCRWAVITAQREATGFKRHTRAAPTAPVYLSMPIGFSTRDGAPVTYADVLLAPGDAYADREWALDLRRAVARLPERSQRVIGALYGDGWTARRLAASLGVSSARASELRLQALRRLRRLLAGLPLEPPRLPRRTRPKGR